MLKTKSEILKIAPYVAGKSKVAGHAKVIKLSSNENGLGCSPLALKAYREFDALNRYPDGSALELREAIGLVHNLPPENIICGAGSDEILEMLAYAYCGEGTQVLYTEHGFLVYPIAAQSAGAKPVAVKERDFRTDVDAVIEAVTDKTRIVFIANPNNPTGSYISAAEMQRLRDGLPEDVLLVIDSAYDECVTAKDYSSGAEIVAGTNNTIMVRTFSKMYGLANLRLGWAYAGVEIIDILNRIRPPFNVTGPSIAVGITALADTEFLARSVAHNNKWRDLLFAELERLGFEPIPSQGNFVLAKFGDGKKAFEFFAGKGILLREVANYGLPEYLRISVGSEDEMAVLFKALGEYSKLITTT